MTYLMKVLTGLTVVVALIGCSSEKDRVRSIDLARTLVDELKPEKVQPPVVATRATLQGITDPLILVRTQKDGGLGLLGVQAVNGDYVTWRTADDISLVIHGQVLSSTRRFGQDIISALTPVSPANQSRFRREYSYLGGDEQIVKAIADCEYTVEKSETIVVLDQKFLTQKFLERCISDQLGEYTNIYWLDRRGIAVRSEQYVSPKTGFLTLERINQ
ncbi:YjbF family lipoprotein [Algirhabdus cladophorae]|uniref:YjbF family lipoprotein n=1 Tax=Algirhabdus cladophorae TaxID=3377108 RepID=UPI003B845DB1